MTDRFDEMAEQILGIEEHRCDPARPATRCHACERRSRAADVIRAAVAAETERCAGIAKARAMTMELRSDELSTLASNIDDVMRCNGGVYSARAIAAAILAETVTWTQSADSTREDQVWTASANGVDLRVVYEYNDYERGGSVDCVIEWTAVTSKNVYGPFAASTLPNAKSDAEEFARKMAR